MHFQESSNDCSGEIGRRAGIEKHRSWKRARVGSAWQFYRQRRGRDGDRSVAVDRADPGNGAERARDRIGNGSANRGGGRITMATLPKKIAVLMGGPGSERDVSLATGRGVVKALRSLGAEVVEVDVRDEKFQLPQDVDLAFITIHGTFGEDGQIQKILERRGIAYTGEGVTASEIAFDKIRTKEKFQEHGVTTPSWEVIHPGQRPTFPLPIVVKAPRQGSTVGVVIVKGESEIEPAISEAGQY